MTAIDWPGLLARGLAPRRAGGLALRPAEFWALSPRELSLMLGTEGRWGGIDRQRLAGLMAAYPDGAPGEGGGHGRDRSDGRAIGGVGKQSGGGGPVGGGV